MDVNVELYVKSKDRWLIDATFPGHQESIAVDEAKQLSSQKHVQAVKVIREVIDPASGSKKEKTVFTTEPEKSGDDYAEKTSEDDKKEEKSEKNWMDEIPDDKPNLAEVKKKKTKNNVSFLGQNNKKGSLIIKMLVIVILSCGFASIMTLVFQKFGISLYNKFGV